MTSAGLWVAKILNSWFTKTKNSSADLPVVDCELSIPETMIIMDSTAPASFVKGTLQKALKCPNRTIFKTFVHLEEMVD